MFNDLKYYHTINIDEWETETSLHVVNNMI